MEQLETTKRAGLNALNATRIDQNLKSPVASTCRTPQATNQRFLAAYAGRVHDASGNANRLKPA
jgi:hypothetical protein